MAVFDPQFESPDPSYLKLSKPTGEAMADTSTGQAIAAFGKGLEGAVGLADTAFKDTIKNEIATRSDAAKDDFLGQLEQFQRRNNTTPTTPNGPSVPLPRSDPRKANAMASDDDLTATDNTPAGLQAGLQGVQKIGNAISQSGKTRTTDLDANLTDILKDLRNRFPGYRDYIDQQGSSIIGYNPGNKLIADKVAQINESMSNAAKTKDYWEKQIAGSGFEGAPEALAKFKQTGNTDWAEAWYAQNNTAHQRIADSIAKFKLLSDGDAFKKAQGEDAANLLADEAATGNFRNRRFINSDKTSPTSSQIQDQLNDLSVHPEKRNPIAIRNLGIQLVALENQNTTETRMAMQSSGVYAAIGTKKAEEIISSKITGLYGLMHKQLSDEQFGLVHATQNAAVDVISDRAMQVLADPSIGGIVATGGVLNRISPFLAPDYTKSVLGDSDFGGKLFNLSKQQVRQGATQTGGIYDGPGLNGKVYTFQQAMEEQDKAQKIVNASPQDRVEGIKKVLELKQALMEKDPRAVDAGISFFFDPTNQSSLNKWLKDDYYEPGKGVVKGATSTFDELHDPRIVKNIWDRAHAGNGLAWDNYKDWSDRYAIPALTTMAKTWAVNESQLKSQKMIQGDMPSGTDHHFYYNSDTQQIGITNLKGEPMDINSTYRVNPDVFMVRNANMVLKSLSNIANQEGSDPNAYVFRTLYRAGWKDTPADVEVQGKGMSTVSSRILDAIIHSQPPEKTESGETKTETPKVVTKVSPDLDAMAKERQDLINRNQGDWKAGALDRYDYLTRELRAKGRIR